MLKLVSVTEPTTVQPLPVSIQAVIVDPTAEMPIRFPAATSCDHDPIVVGVPPDDSRRYMVSVPAART